MSTPIDTIIKAGEDIPEDVTEVDDKDGDHWFRSPRADYPWGSSPGVGGFTNSGLETWFPLTVTAVRPQPADEPEVDGDLTPERHCGADDTHQGHHWAGGYWCEGFVGRAGVPAAESESVDLLDLVRQYGDENYELGKATALLDDDAQDHYDGKARRLFARIEAEVDRLRGEVERLTMSIDSQIRAKESWIGACESIKDVVTRPLCLLLHVHRNEDIVPAVERLRDEASKARGLALELAATEQMLKVAMTDVPDPSAPLVLSLPEVPPGTVALVGKETGQRWRRVKVPGITLPCWQSELVGPLDLGAMLDAEPDGVRVVMREPRTWTPLPIAEIGLKVRGSSGNLYLFKGLPNRPHAHVDSIGDTFFGSWMTLSELRELDGPLVEVFDEDGTP